MVMWRPRLHHRQEKAGAPDTCAASYDLRTSARQGQLFEDVPCQTGPGADTEPLVDALQVGCHRALTDEQPVGDLRIAQPLGHQPGDFGLAGAQLTGGDRKSTRLNSSHVRISYAVFCLKKKKKQ